MAGTIKLDGATFLEKDGGNYKISNTELKLKSSGNTIVDSNGNAVLSESGGNVSIGNIRLPANGGIKDSSGNNVLSESGGSVTLGGVTITGGKIDDVNLGNVSSAEANLKWNDNSDTYTENTTLHRVTAVHRNMKRCVLNADGTVNYYLNETDSTKKADGTTANIDGSDGNVMVEIPKFWLRQTRFGNQFTWEISDTAKTGYSVHPAFIKNGVEVSHRYIGAYSACYLDATDSTYKSGKYVYDYSSYLDLSNDKLSSVSGVYPLVGVTRAQCRSLAENNGSGWRVCDFYLMSAVQLLYLIEYGTFNTQSVLGNGNTNDSFDERDESTNQADSPTSIAGLSNSLGNGSTNVSTGAWTVTDPPTAFMSYRGIENWYGNVGQFLDGINPNANGDYTIYASNTDTDFADGTATNYTDLGYCSTDNGYINSIKYTGQAGVTVSEINVDGLFIPNHAFGASSSTYLCDYYYRPGTGNSNLVCIFGGAPEDLNEAGGFYYMFNAPTSYTSQVTGSRIAF